MSNLTLNDIITGMLVVYVIYLNLRITRLGKFTIGGFERIGKIFDVFESVLRKGSK